MERARSATEAFFFQRLETLSETAGRFRLNLELPIPFDGWGNMEVDVLCPEARLVIELDGGQHLASAAAYRRDALTELNELKARLADPGSRLAALVALPPLVKRVVLSSAVRSDVASLSGTAWLHFLDQTARRSTFTGGPGSLLPTLAYASSDRLAAISDSEVHTLVALIEEWIRTHEIPAGSPAVAH